MRRPRRPLKLFLIELAMAWAGQKHAVALDPAYKLPRLRYKGGAVQPQHLRLDRGPVSTIEYEDYYHDFSLYIMVLLLQ